MAAYMAYTEALKKAGALVGSNRLQPFATATTVKMANGKQQVLDGPYADSKEQLGGYYLIEAPDLDAAIAWAAPLSGRGTRHHRGAARLDDVRQRALARLCLSREPQVDRNVALGRADRGEARELALPWRRYGDLDAGCVGHSAALAGGPPLVLRLVRAARSSPSTEMESARS